MPRGRPPKNKEENTNKPPKTIKNKLTCFYCGNEYVETNFYKSNSIFYNNIGKIPYCKQCIEKLYQQFYEKYKNEGILNPERKAIKRLCMILDVYFAEDAYGIAMERINVKKIDISPMGAYMSIIQLTQYNRKNETYENTITYEEKKEFQNSFSDISESENVDEKTKEFFGKGFLDEDYEFLKKQYDDWTSRHECQTKAQEEVFKRICFKQLEILKATRLGEDTKNLDATFRDLLDTAKLQPKQNSGETVSDAQTFGTLIDKWETTRPIPEVEEELKDVDKIGLLTHVFYTGHIAKVLNLPSSLTALYDKFMKKYTVERQECSSDSDNEALFNSIFGKKSIDEQDE